MIKPTAAAWLEVKSAPDLKHLREKRMEGGLLLFIRDGLEHRRRRLECSRRSLQMRQICDR